MQYVGVDLGWTERGHTGICVLDAAGRQVLLTVVDDATPALAQRLLPYLTPGTYLALDAPLIVLQDSQEKSRACERELMRMRLYGHRVPCFCTSRAYMERAFGGVRAERLVAELTRLGANVQTAGPDDEAVWAYETYPAAILASLLPAMYPLAYKKAKSRVEQLAAIKRGWRGLQAQVPEVQLTAPELPENLSAQQLKLQTDLLDAALCAVAAWWCHERDMLVLGDYTSGAMVLPAT